jgi:hypothetical protein
MTGKAFSRGDAEDAEKTQRLEMQPKKIEPDLALPFFANVARFARKFESSLNRFCCLCALASRLGAPSFGCEKLALSAIVTLTNLQ